jgi:hypothetical protein
MSINDNTVLARLRQAREPKAKKQCEAPKRTVPLKKATKPIKGRSEKMRGIIAALRPLYDAFLKDKEECAIKSPVCTGRAECVHHEEGRGIKVVLDQSKWKECCRACNGWVESKDAEAREKGHKKSRHANNS